MTEPLRVAIVGAGWMGETHARAVAANGDVVVAVVDRDAERRERLTARSGAVGLGDLDQLGDVEAGVDAVVVATPPGEHVRQTAQALGAGFACLVEKPHRLPFQDPAELLGLTSEAAPVCRVGMTTRHSAGLCAVYDAIATGEIGSVVEITDRIWFTLHADTLPVWYFDRAVSGGGVLLTNGVHSLDRVAWLLGEPLTVTNAHLAGVIPGHEVEDHAVVTGVSSGSGVPFTVSLLWSDYANGGSSLDVVGEAGRARVDADGSWVVSSRAGIRHGPPAHGDVAFEQQWTRFAAAVSGAAPDAGPGPHELEPTLELIERIYRDQATEESITR